MQVMKIVRPESGPTLNTSRYPLSTTPSAAASCFATSNIRPSNASSAPVSSAADSMWRLGDDKQMHRRLRLDVAQCEAGLIVVQLVDRYRAGSELTKQAV